ncbi:MAG: class I SAM-dependent rRNA methyltransferase [Gemmataceae bacterium]
MPPLPIVRLSTERRTNHPWIFQKMVDKPERKPQNGCIVDIEDRTGQWVGRGIYNGHSRIALRVLTVDPNEAINDEFFARKIQYAISLRRDVLNLDRVTDSYRLVHSEADGLSGLVIDKFGKTIVIEYFSSGMFRQRDAIRATLESQFPGSTYYWFAEEHVQKQESFDCRAPEPPTPGVITEHGLQFRVAPGGKHKTGFFLDQRDNRKRFSERCAGRRVLDLCCNSGGFSIYAKAAGGASEVVGVDIDESILGIAKQNAQLNKAQVRFVQADLFTWLRDVLPNGERFGAVVLDPAKLTRDRDDVDGALRKYQDMNKLALQAVEPGGVFLTCSCTGLVSEPDFLEMLRRAAYNAGRSVQIFEISGAAPDHPFLAHVREGRYLKAVFCRVW